MRTHLVTTLLLGLTLVLGAAAAQNTTINNNPPPAGGTPEINVNNPTPVVNIDGDDNDGQESTFVGMDTTMVLIVVVVAVLAVALIVALAGRDRWW